MDSISEGPSKAIVVLGMHRSGTSALAGVLHLLGGTMPKTLEPANAANPRGYWESQRLMRANDDLLQAAGSRWNDWRRFDLDWANTAVGQAHIASLRQAFLDEFGDAELPVVKDPRICRYFPIFRAVLAEVRRKPAVLLPIRNPFEVAQSIRTRDHTDPSASLL
ncbi:MAG TPA: sulfotransferase family protein, partial [Devosia sp.]|nr:sulfotransferase family protein [Devosia sp.]